MRKMKLIAVFVLLIMSISTYAQTSNYPADKSLEDQRNWLRANTNIDVQGDNFIYNPSTNTLTVSSDKTIAQIPSAFTGKIVLDGYGIIKIDDGFKGNVEINFGSIILANKGTFTGTGKYSTKDGLTITKGNVLLYNYATPIALENANRVTFGGNKIEGTCANGCSVSNQKLGQGAAFTYTLEGGKHKVKLTGKPELPTLPNANIKQTGSKFYLGNSNIELDTDSKIYITKGSTITINGRELTAEKETLELSFDMSRRIIRAFVLPYNPSQKKVNLRTDSKSKQYSAEAGYIVDEPRRINSRNNLNNNDDLKRFIETQANNYGVDLDFVLAICAVETSCTPKPTCNKNSCGMFQISPDAVSDVNRNRKLAMLKGEYKWENVKNNQYTNAEAAIQYLALLLKKYNGNKILAAAAYNAGLGNVDRYRGVPPFSITRAYVGKVNAYTSGKPILEKK